MMREKLFHEAIANRHLPCGDDRFGIYRNNVNSALVNALRVRFPATATLLGPGEFAERAMAFSRDHLPASPVLITYGEPFAQGLPEPVAAVARLDNLWWKAYHSAEARPVPADFLASFTPEALFELRFRFHPSLGMIAVESGAASVWDQARRGIVAGFGQLQEFVLVARPEAEVHVRLLSETSFQFVARLAEGQPLGAVVEAMTGPGFDPAAEIAGLLSHHIIIGA